jgi:RHS repeat-associated protein
VVTYSYDPAGNVRSTGNDPDWVTTEYDEAGRARDTFDTFDAEASFAYDSEGNLIRRIAAKGPLGSNPNYTTNYSYDVRGSLTGVSDPAGRSYTFFYDPRGLLKASQYPNGTFSWIDANADGWTTAVYNRHGTLTAPLPGSVPNDSLASPLADFSYTYTLEGQKSSETRSGGALSTETTGYGYDGLGRLADVTLPSGTQRHYSYDLDSNRTAITENNATVASYSYDPSQTPGVDQLSSITQGGQTTSYTYSSDGETTGRGPDATLQWDGWGRHSGAYFGDRLGGGTQVGYEFDPAGFRRRRTVTSVPECQCPPTTLADTRYLLGGLFEKDASGTLTNTDIDGPPGDLAHYAGPPTTSSTASFEYYNAHGDVAAEADIAGNRTGAYTYDPFGAPNQQVTSSTPVERWTGRWDKKLDPQTTLIEMGARPYDPALGRFLAVDPVDGGSLSNYDYAGQDPVNSYDLDGRSTTNEEGPEPPHLTPEQRRQAIIQWVADVLDNFGIPRPGNDVDIYIIRDEYGFEKGFYLRKAGAPNKGEADTFRYMEPGADPRYPDGYVRYWNKDGEPIDPATGHPGPDHSPLTHRTPSYNGKWKGLPDWWG